MSRSRVRPLPALQQPSAPESPTYIPTADSVAVVTAIPLPMLMQPDASRDVSSLSYKVFCLERELETARLELAAASDATPRDYSNWVRAARHLNRVVDGIWCALTCPDSIRDASCICCGQVYGDV